MSNKAFLIRFFSEFLFWISKLRQCNKDRLTDDLRCLQKQCWLSETVGL